MPLPKPRPTEKEKEFIERCIVDTNIKKEFNPNQYYPICKSIWDSNKSNRKT